jgi:hypothetical protein
MKTKEIVEAVAITTQVDLPGIDQGLLHQDVGAAERGDLDRDPDQMNEDDEDHVVDLLMIDVRVEGLTRYDSLHNQNVA